VDALPALDHQRTGLAKLVEIGVGMDQRFDVANGEVARHSGHHSLDPHAGLPAERKAGKGFS
jgi:hypothetical protein